MTFLSEIDQDKLLVPVIGTLREPFPFWVRRYWIREEFFLDELFRIAQANGPLSLDVGLRREIQMRTWIFALHRAGAGQEDVYGSDFAITLDVRDVDLWRKTALFQLKVSADQFLKVTRDQLNEVMKHACVAKRTFVMAADRLRHTLRIEETAKVLDEFRKGTRTHQCDAASWLASTEWMMRWLRCEVGILSDPSDASSIERLLNSHAIPPRSEYFGYDENPTPLEEMRISARYWIVSRINLNRDSSARR